MVADVNDSIRDLESRNRGLKIAFLALAGLPWLLAATAQDQPKPKLPPGTPPITPAQTPDGAKIFISKEPQDLLKAEKEIHNVLRARVIALVDAKGNPKWLLSTDEKGSPMLSMFGIKDPRNDHVALTLGLDSNRPQIFFNDTFEKPRLGLYSHGGDRHGMPNCRWAPAVKSP
jgi:hypothetical protein